MTPKNYNFLQALIFKRSIYNQRLQNMSEAFLLSNLLKLRIQFYKKGVIERLQRFRLLVFFILASVVPTFGLLIAIIQVISKSLMIVYESNQYNLQISIFQLVALIWIGSQYDILMNPDFESYLNSLKMKRFQRVIIEYVFGLFVTMPFVMLLITGLYNALLQHYDTLYLARFLYLLCTLSFVSICVVFKRINYVWLLLLTNTIVSYSNLVLIDTLCGVMPLFISHKIFFCKKYLQRFIEETKNKIKMNFFYNFPNLKLYVKSLIVHDKIYTGCIFGITVLIMMIYVACIQHDMNAEKLFLIVTGFMMYFLSLLSYKLDESRRNYGVYFSKYYSKTKLYFTDLIVLVIMASINLIALTILAVHFKVDSIYILQTLSTSLIILMACVGINKKLVFSGPVFSLAATVSVLMIV